MSPQDPHAPLDRPSVTVASHRELTASLDLPYSHSAVVGGGSKEGRIGGEGNVGDARRVRVEGSIQVERGERVKVDGEVRGWGMRRQMVAFEEDYRKAYKLKLAIYRLD